MGEAKRRRLAGEIFRDSGDAATMLRQIADTVLSGTGEAPMIGIGPLVWNIDTGHDRRDWYFMAASIDVKDELRINQIKTLKDRRLAEQTRKGLLAELASRRPIVITDFDDELAMARWCEALCPGERTRRIRENLEAERQS